jgi:hypothetical protein
MRRLIPGHTSQRQEEDKMKHQLSKSVALGIAAALTFGFAETAGAQATDTTRTRTVTRSRTTVTSSRRIPVRKDESGTTTSEASGSLAPQPNADSLAAVERARQDSIAAAELVIKMHNDSIARADSIAAAERERIRRLSKGDLYFRLGAGASIPQSDFSNAYKTGFNVTGSLGYHKWNSPLGVRLDVGYDHFSPKSALSSLGVSNSNIWSGLGEVTLKVPGAMAVTPYAVGGGGFYHFSSTGSGTKSTTKGGWNAGAGLTFGVGMAKLFIEGRYMHVATPTTATKYIPVILGFSF